MTYLRKGRWVLTHEQGGWPVGLVTGIPDRKGGFRIEHVTTTQRGIRELHGLVEEGLKEAWTEFDYLTFHLPRAFRLAKKLRRFALSLGFTVYAEDDVCEHFILRRV